MNSVCKDKILRYEVHPVVKKIITIHCTVVTWERKREIKETSNFYWKGLKKAFRHSITNGSHTSKVFIWPQRRAQQ